MLLSNKLCADVGTVNCPCYLAEYGKCIVCSRLGANGSAGETPEEGGSEVPGTVKGLGICDCKWQGVCIYNEYLQNNLCVKELTGSAGSDGRRQSDCGEQRYGIQCEIQKIKWFDDDLAVLCLSVPRGMTEKAALPGSFVFVRAPGTECYFDFPLSVMRADYETGTIELAVKMNGPKNRALIEGVGCSKCESSIDDRMRRPLETKTLELGLENRVLGYIELRGIFRNGLLGVEKLLHVGEKVIRGSDATIVAPDEELSKPVRVLCLTKGVGIVPIANYIRWAQSISSGSVGGGTHDKNENRNENGNRVPKATVAGVQIDVIADLEKINREFANYALGIACSGDQGSEMRAPRVGGDEAGIRDLHSVTYGPLPLNLSWAEQEKYDVVVISASEYYQQNIYVPEAKKVLSNNTCMCCGEGVCGACMCTGRDGSEHRMCKKNSVEC